VTGVSEGQAQEIRAWLGAKGFRKAQGPTERWFRDETSVKLTEDDGEYRVEILHGTASQRWQGIDELLALRSTWPEAATMRPLELVTSPRLHADRKSFSFGRDPGNWLYRGAQPFAHGIKVLLQMIVGVGAVCDIAWHVGQSVSTHSGTAPFAPAITTSVTVIASALAVAAAIELAYTLFTPGPDEALEPLMLGLSSGILFLISEPAGQDLSVSAQFSAVLLGVLALGVLFFIRSVFLRDDE
jgi:hypothetical protein